jgi:hypothetical protein
VYEDAGQEPEQAVVTVTEVLTNQVRQYQRMQAIPHCHQARIREATQVSAQSMAAIARASIQRSWKATLATARKAMQVSVREAREASRLSIQQADQGYRVLEAQQRWMAQWADRAQRRARPERRWPQQVAAAVDPAQTGL